MGAVGSEGDKSLRNEKSILIPYFSAHLSKSNRRVHLIGGLLYVRWAAAVLCLLGFPPCDSNNNKRKKFLRGQQPRQAGSKRSQDFIPSLAPLELTTFCCVLLFPG